MNEISAKELCQNLDGKDEAEVYQNMYQSLFRDISKVLTTLETRDIASFEDAIKMLEDTQCRTEEIFLAVPVLF